MSLFRETVAASIRWSGLAALVRNTWAKNRVSVLVYHDPSPDVLERHLEYLAKRYTFITLSDVVDALGSEAWTSLPKHSLVVTFDDGRRNNAKLQDLFARYRIVPTIFLCSQIVATTRHFWFLDVADSDAFKPFPNEERLELLANRGFSPKKEYGERHALSLEEIAGLKGLVEFGAHSRFHPVLTTCSDAECEVEIAEGKAEIEALIGDECRHFAYPNGDYGEREINLAKKAGYRSARTLDVGWNDRNTDPFRLKMLGTIDKASVTRLAADLSGIPGYLSRLREGSPRGRHRPSMRRSRSLRSRAAASDPSQSS